jgi:hypothetical protein
VMVCIVFSPYKQKSVWGISHTLPFARSACTLRANGNSPASYDVEW